LQHYGCDLCGEVWVIEIDDTEQPPPPVKPPKADSDND